jgi:hypothetical protein
MYGVSLVALLAILNTMDFKQSVHSRTSMVAQFSLFLGATLILFGPAIVSYIPYRLTWDDTYFFHRSMALNRAWWDMDLGKALDVMKTVGKSPVMALTSLPWGRAGSSETIVGTSLLTLVVATWTLAVACVYFLLRLRCRRWFVLLAGTTIFLNPFLSMTAGKFFVDGLLCWIVLLLLLLPPFEAEASPKSIWNDIGHGLLWAVPAGLGCLAKVTFGFFLLFTIPYLLFLRYRSCGKRSALVSILAFSIAGSPVAAVWYIFGDQFMHHARLAAWGEMAKYYGIAGGPGWGPIKMYWTEIGWSAPLQAVLLILALLTVVRSRFRVPLARVFPLVILLGYFLIAIQSVNQDLRFYMPVMIGMPLCLGLLAPNDTEWMPGSSRSIILWCALGAVILASLPMVQSPDLRKMQMARSLLLESEHRGFRTITVATDSPELNVETLTFIDGLLHTNGRPCTIWTLAYDAATGKPEDTSVQTMKRSDVVVFQNPTPPYPDFTNSRVPSYRKYVEENGKEFYHSQDGSVSAFQIKR